MNKFTSNIVSGVTLGVVAAFLVHFGNPGNMGVCAACFLRDSAGALGFHRAAVVQYLRPEIIGLIVGGLLCSLFWTKDYKSQNTSSPFLLFFLGVFAMIGCLIFLGCPWRAFLRLGGGDMSAIAGVVGLVCGVYCGRFCKKRFGYTLADETESNKAMSAIPIAISLLLLLALVFGLKVGENGALFSSIKGPGSQHAPIWIALAGGVLIGIVMRKSKFCSVGAFAKIADREYAMFGGVIAIIVGATIANLALSQYHLGFTNQPIAHNEFVWSFLGMMLAGFCFSLSQGCPGKHLVNMGSGNLGSSIFIIGMMAGGSIAHNFSLASSGAGASSFAPYALIAGFAFCIFAGVTNKKRA